VINRVKYKIVEDETKVSLLVEIEPRFINKEDVTTFTLEDAEKILLDKKIDYDKILTSPNTHLSNKNKGSLQNGEWTFLKKVKVEKSKPRTRKSSRSAKREDKLLGTEDLSGVSS